MNQNGVSSIDQDIRLDLATASIWHGTEQMSLRHKTFAVLEYLLQHQGRIVTKQELFDAVWPGVVVTDTVLGVCISELRQAMGDTAKHPKWIKTIYKRGYCYIGSVDFVENRLSPKSNSMGDTESIQLSSNEEVASRINFTEPADAVETSCSSCRRLSTATEGSDFSIWDVPYLRNPHFVGRGSLLIELRNTFRKRNGNIQIIFGLGGVGKTQLAAEYAYCHAQSYDQVVWLNGESVTSLAMGYTKLARELLIPNTEMSDHSSLVRAVRNWLDQHGNWLVVFDNARDRELLSPYLPHSQSGHVLVTSRHPAWGTSGITRRLSMLPRTDSVSFLLERTGQSDWNGAERLAKALGDLPLALEQASACIQNSSLSITDYCERFTTTDHLLLLQGQPKINYPATVATTWILAFEEIRKQSRLADGLLSLCAISPTTRIRRNWLLNHINQISGRTISDEVFAAAIDILQGHSLIEVEFQYVSMHPLVQSVRRNFLRQHEIQNRNDESTPAAGAVNARDPKVDRALLS